MNLEQRLREIDVSGIVSQMIEAILEEANEFRSVILEPRETFNRAIVGISKQGRLIYDRLAIVQALMEDDGMEMEDADEFVSYNTERSLDYMPEPRPLIIECDEEDPNMVGCDS